MANAKKRIIDNFISLLALQGINTLVPLFTFPYLVYVLGIETFGVYSFISAVITYGVIITDYGFDLSATKHISVNRSDPQKISEIFSSVILIKSFMAIGFFLFLGILILFFDKFHNNAFLYILAFGLVIGQVLFPVWFFQGMEKMRYITTLNALSKLIFAATIFIFVTSKEDLYLVFIFNSVGAIVAGALALYIAIKNFQLSFRLQTKEVYIYYLKDAWYIFTSRVAVQLYQSLNIIVLGFFANDTILGYYAIVVKTIRAATGILSAFPRAVYPYFAKLHKESVPHFYNKNVQFSLGVLLLTIPLTLSVYYFTPEILKLVSGKVPSELMIQLFHIYTPLLLISIYGAHFTNILVILGKTKLLNNIILFAGIVNVLAIYWVIHYFGVVGLTWLTMAIVTIIIVMTKIYFIFFKFQRQQI